MVLTQEFDRTWVLKGVRKGEGRPSGVCRVGRRRSWWCDGGACTNEGEDDVLCCVDIGMQEREWCVED